MLAINSCVQSIVSRLIVEIHVVRLINCVGNFFLCQASVNGFLNNIAVQHVVLVGNSQDGVVNGVVGLEEGVSKSFRRDAAGVLSFLRLAAIHAVHLGALGGLHGSDRQIGVEATPQQSLLGVRITKVAGVERQAPGRQTGQPLNTANRVFNCPN